MFGARVKRIEDPALLRGSAHFADDLHLPGMLHACFVRSPLAHARFSTIDATAALRLDGVRAVFTLADLAPHLTSERIPVAMPSAAIRHEANTLVLAKDEVCHVGEAVALVVADSRHVAEDAAAAVALDYETLPAVADARAALGPDAPRARLDCPDNLCAAFTVEYGNVAAAFAKAPHVFRESYTFHKGGGHAIECRGVVASYDPLDDRLTVWDGTQMPHRAHHILVNMLGCAEHQVRIVPPEVGGGFGPKLIFYPEEVAVPLAAKLLGRPVKWIEDRRENFTATTQERDQNWQVEVAVETDGRLIGIRGELLHDHGAYTPYGVAMPQNSATNLIGPYRLPHYRLAISVVFTNLVPATPTRGAGRPQGTFVMERLMDRIARELGLDRAEVRRRNFIGADEMPYETPVITRDGKAMTYDSGDYPACQERALAHAGYAEFAARQAAARKDGRYIGIGIANYVEGTGRGPFESVVARVGPSGKVEVATGATAQGQGNKTTLAQICVAALGVKLEDITVVAGDTGRIALGLGAFASRQAVTAGSSVHLAATAIRKKALDAASDLMEVAASDLEIEEGRIHVKGVPGMSITLGEIAGKLQGMPGFVIPGGLPPGLEASANFEPQGITYCNGAHVVEVEIDPETGGVRLLRYVVVHDCGRLINPTIVEGQIEGGVVHGIGNALMEHMIYDESGQPQTTNYGEYLLPTAPGLPEIEILHVETPTPLNPLGVKGAGESGTIPAVAVIASAIEDALSPFGVTINDIPITPMRLVEMINRAGGGAP